MQLFKSKQDAQREAERAELLETMRSTRLELENARLCFEYASEPELIEASVFEINSVQARYNYLLRIAREEGLLSTDVLKQLR